MTATAGEGAHGIGGGYLSDRGSVEITGGTVAAAGGEGGMDVGIVGPSGVAGSVVFGGGSILADMAKVKPAAKNASGEAVWRVDVAVPDPDPARAVAVTGLDGYGVADIYPDANGDIHLWLPDGDYAFTVDGARWTATVAGADTVAVPDYVSPDSLHIDAIEVAPGSVTLTVSAEPDGWLTAETAPLLRVRASETLPVSAGELLDASDVVATSNADGTATLLLPAPDPATRFYRVEAP